MPKSGSGPIRFLRRDPLDLPGMRESALLTEQFHDMSSLYRAVPGYKQARETYSSPLPVTTAETAERRSYPTVATLPRSELSYHLKTGG